MWCDDFIQLIYSEFIMSKTASNIGEVPIDALRPDSRSSRLLHRSRVVSTSPRLQTMGSTNSSVSRSMKPIPKRNTNSTNGRQLPPIDGSNEIRRVERRVSENRTETVEHFRNSREANISIKCDIRSGNGIPPLTNSQREKTDSSVTVDRCPNGATNQYSQNAAHVETSFDSQTPVIDNKFVQEARPTLASRRRQVVGNAETLSTRLTMSQITDRGDRPIRIGRSQMSSNIDLRHVPQTPRANSVHRQSQSSERSNAPRAMRAVTPPTVIPDPVSPRPRRSPRSRQLTLIARQRCADSPEERRSVGSRTQSVDVPQQQRNNSAIEESVIQPRPPGRITFTHEARADRNAPAPVAPRNPGDSRSVFTNEAIVPTVVSQQEEIFPAPPNDRTESLHPQNRAVPRSASNQQRRVATSSQATPEISAVHGTSYATVSDALEVVESVAARREQRLAELRSRRSNQSAQIERHLQHLPSHRSQFQTAAPVQDEIEEDETNSNTDEMNMEINMASGPLRNLILLPPPPGRDMASFMRFIVLWNEVRETGISPDEFLFNMLHGGSLDTNIAMEDILRVYVLLTLTQQMDNSGVQVPAPLSDEEIIKLPKRKAQNADPCAVCLVAPAETMVFLPCKHEFHTECIVAWLKKSATCPMCRNEVKL